MDKVQNLKSSNTAPSSKTFREESCLLYLIPKKAIPYSANINTTQDEIIYMKE
jgi:hypothetical protein